MKTSECEWLIIHKDIFFFRTGSFQKHKTTSQRKKHYIEQYRINKYVKQPNTEI